MAGITEMNSLAARKQALVAESEIYRQALAAELQNLQGSAERITRNLRFLRFLKPILLVAPLVGSILGMRASPKPQKRQAAGWRRWWGAVLVGWRLYRQVAPALSHFISRRRHSASSHRRFREISP